MMQAEIELLVSSLIEKYKINLFFSSKNISEFPIVRIYLNQYVKKGILEIVFR